VRTGGVAWSPGSDLEPQMAAFVPLNVVLVVMIAHVGPPVVSSR
jgi:hypothetical protein